jgi:hypothetical protein
MQHSQALKYRLKAAEVRAIAEDDDHALTKSDLIRVAEAYEMVARTFENLEGRDVDQY